MLKIKVKHREIGREKALQLLYQRELSKSEIDKVINYFEFGEIPDDAVLYAIDLFEEIERNKEEIDEVIKNHLIKWEWNRILPVDRNILRIGTYELLYRKDIPTGAIIDQAVRLAKRFGGYEDSFRFINGILGRIANEVRSEEKNRS